MEKDLSSIESHWDKAAQLANEKENSWRSCIVYVIRTGGTK